VHENKLMAKKHSKDILFPKKKLVDHEDVYLSSKVKRLILN
jgi:hypothetical protein